MQATLASYLKECLQYIESISCSKLSDEDLEQAYIPFMNSILETVEYLEVHGYEGNEEEELFKQVALNADLFEIIRGVLMIGSTDNKCCFIFRGGEIRRVCSINKLKSYAIKSIVWLM